MPRLAKVLNDLAIGQVKQGTETTGLRMGFTLHSCQYVSQSTPLVLVCFKWVPKKWIPNRDMMANESNLLSNNRRLSGIRALVSQNSRRCFKLVPSGDSISYVMRSYVLYHVLS